jgi:hypothetical protein
LGLNVIKYCNFHAGLETSITEKKGLQIAWSLGININNFILYVIITMMCSASVKFVPLEEYCHNSKNTFSGDRKNHWPGYAIASKE